VLEVEPTAKAMAKMPLKPKMHVIVSRILVSYHHIISQHLL